MPSGVENMAFFRFLATQALLISGPVASGTGPASAQDKVAKSVENLISTFSTLGKICVDKDGMVDLLHALQRPFPDPEIRPLQKAGGVFERQSENTARAPLTRQLNAFCCAPCRGRQTSTFHSGWET